MDTLFSTNYILHIMHVEVPQVYGRESDLGEESVMHVVYI